MASSVLRLRQVYVAKDRLHSIVTRESAISVFFNTSGFRVLGRPPRPGQSDEPLSTVDDADRLEPQSGGMINGLRWGLMM